MRFALLGVDSESLALAQAAEELGHLLVWPVPWGNGRLPAPQRASPDWAPVDPAPDQTDWEQLLDRQAIDAVVMGTGQANADLRARQLSDLLRQGQSVLAVHPLFDQVLTYFEIDMVRHESGALLCHFNPLTTHAVAAQIARSPGLLSDGDEALELGRVEQLVATRFTSERSAARVMWHFARDVELLEQLAGRLDRVGAHGAEGLGAYAGLSVQLLGRQGCPVRWSVAPPASGAALEAALIGERGRTTVTWDETGRLLSAWTWANERRAELDVVDQEPTLQAVERFFGRAELRIASTDAAVGDGESTWSAALHAMELADSIEISLRRGRMIDVHEQQLTEELAFKGTMAAAGCGLLVVVLPLLLVAGWLAGVMGIPVAAYWPHALLSVLAIFLALQVLPRLLLRKPIGDDTSERL